MKLNQYFYPDLIRDEIILKYNKYVVDTNDSNTFIEATKKQKKEALKRMEQRKKILDRYFEQFL